MAGLPWTMEELLAFGELLDTRPVRLVGESVGTWMARALLRVRTRDGSDRPLQANAAQLRFEQERTRRNIVLKARQMGITTWVSGHFFLRTISNPGVLTVQVAQTREAAEGIFRIAQRFWEGLPAELRDGPLRLSRSNAGQMRFSSIDSEFRVLSASDENAGRGLTIQNLHCSELGRWPGDASMTLAGLRAALSPGGELVLESTPNGAYGCFYNEWLYAEERGIRRHFFPWWMEREFIGAPAQDPTLAEQELMARHGLTAGQIGFRRTLEREYQGLRLQEFAEDAHSCFRASGECCFDVNFLEQRMMAVTPPVFERMSGALAIWLPPVAGRDYLIAVDTAGGGSDGDYAVAEVLELETGLQCAELRRRVGFRDLAAAVSEMAQEYFGALVAVERNNHGAAVLAYLETEHPQVELYEQNGQPGWLTSAASKPRMISQLGSLLAEQPWLFFSRHLLAECRTFVTLPGGGSGAAPGAHDDCVMAIAIGHSVRGELLTRGRRSARNQVVSGMLQRRGFPGGGAGGSGDSAYARRGAESTDAGGRWPVVGGEVSEQSAAPPRAGE